MKLYNQIIKKPEGNTLEEYLKYCLKKKKKKEEEENSQKKREKFSRCWFERRSWNDGNR